MKPCALYIPRNTASDMDRAIGYRDTLKYCGWEFVISLAKTKIEMIEWIERNNIQLIFAPCKHGTRQLPVDFLNRNNIPVVVQAMPLNPAMESLDGTYCCADPADLGIVSSLKKKMLITPLEASAIDRFLSTWVNAEMIPVQLRNCANFFSCKPTCSTKYNSIGIVGSYWTKSDTWKQWLGPVLKHLDNRFAVNVVGDLGWQELEVPLMYQLKHYAGMANVYAESDVCPNLHTKMQRELGASVNARTFNIALCGGYQITDSLVAKELLGEGVVYAENVSDFGRLVVDQVKNPTQDHARKMRAMKEVAEHHTYFNRLSQIFRCLISEEAGDKVERAGKRLAFTHCHDLGGIA